MTEKNGREIDYAYLVATIAGIFATAIQVRIYQMQGADLDAIHLIWPPLVIGIFTIWFALLAFDLIDIG